MLGAARAYQQNAVSDFIQADVWSENIIELEQGHLRAVVERICRQCRYPLLALRLFLHILTGIDGEGRVPICARQLSKSMDVHYDTVTKCLKFLREIEAIQIER